jgi:chromosome segregation ATPase
LASGIVVEVIGGKSAILTGIAIALGGKAAITGRGSGIKDLIRKGCE